MKKLLAIFLAVLLLAGCAAPAQEGETTQPTTATEPEQAQPVTTQIDVSALFSDRDRDASYSSGREITLSGDAITCNCSGVEISGTTATITDEGTYILRGSLEDGQIIVDTGKDSKVQLVLDGVDITCKDGAAVHIKQADKVFVTLAANKENSLTSQQNSSADSKVDGAIFSKEDITLNGKGSLTIAAQEGNGVVSKDELTVTSGSYTVTCAGHGFQGKDSVAILSAAMTITSGKDGIHAENDDDTAMGYLYIADGSYQIIAQGDGISASSAMQLDGGNYDITTGGSVNGETHSAGFGGGWGGFGGWGGGWENTQTKTETDSVSNKGIKAGTALVINGGNYTINAADDGIHCNGDLTVTGGQFQIATGDDGFHADGNLVVTGGRLGISESYEGLEALHVKIQGGEITLKATDDGINAAGGTDESGFGGMRGDDFGGRGPGRPTRGGWGGFGGGNSNGSILISGGTVAITANGDGVDANGSLEITGGYITVCGPTRGDTSILDFDTTGTITGGTFVGTGAVGMNHGFTESAQGVVSARMGEQPAGTKLTVSDSTGKVLLEITPHLDFNLVIVSTPEMEKGQRYTIPIENIPLSYDAW